MANKNLRDYGLGESTSYVRGVPRILGEVVEKDGTKMACPNCKCPTTFRVQVTVEHPRLRGGSGLGDYLGCAACPWASLMVMVADESRKDES